MLVLRESLGIEHPLSGSFYLLFLHNLGQPTNQPTNHAILSQCEMTSLSSTTFLPVELRSLTVFCFLYGVALSEMTLCMWFKCFLSLSPLSPTGVKATYEQAQCCLSPTQLGLRFASYLASLFSQQDFQDPTQRMFMLLEKIHSSCRHSKNCRSASLLMGKQNVLVLMKGNRPN